MLFVLYPNTLSDLSVVASCVVVNVRLLAMHICVCDIQCKQRIIKFAHNQNIGNIFQVNFISVYGVMKFAQYILYSQKYWRELNLVV